MKVIFIKNVKGVARIGDVKTVSDGYARNYLLPRNIAMAATQNAIKQAESLQLVREQQGAKDRALAEQIAAKKIVIEIEEAANAEGHLYGSVDIKRLTEEIAKAGFKLEPEVIELEAPLKKTGAYEVKLDIHPEVPVTITVNIKALENKTSA